MQTVHKEGLNMTVDKKSQHVGNHGGTYTDLDGQSKQFTYIDHDKKSKVSLHNEKIDKSFFKDYRSGLVERILSITAAICPEEYYDFTVRGENRNVITWNENMLKDEGVGLDRLRNLCVLLENKAEMMNLI